MAVYLIHFTQPYHHAQHYVGFTTRPIEERIDEHQRTHAHLLGAVNRARIPWLVAQVWHGAGRDFERYLKSWSGAAQFCPICLALAGKPSPAIVPENMRASLSPQVTNPPIPRAVPRLEDVRAITAAVS